MGMQVDTLPPSLNKPHAPQRGLGWPVALATPVLVPLLALGLVLGAVLWAPPGLAQSAGKAGADPEAKLHDVERKIESQRAESERQKARAAKLKEEMDAVNAELIAAASRVQDHEAQVAALESDLAHLEREAALKTEQLRERRNQFSGVVMALTRIARFPTEALVAQPMPPEDTVRSAILLRAAVPAIELRAATLRGELRELASARSQVQTQRSDLQSAVDLLRVEEGRIEVIRKQKAALRAEAISKSRVAQSKANALGRKAKNIRDLMDRLQSERKKAQALAAAEAQKRREAARQDKAASTLHVQPESTEPAVDVAALGTIGSISKARGRLPFPVVGKLVGLYGQPLDGGQTRKGISLETREGAQVIAPFDGKVVFAGPFRGYGQLLIIDHGEGYHSLLAGLGRIDAIIGQSVLAGEPVAVMTGGQTTASDHASGTPPGGQAILYVEFRRDNEPINPMPWLASRKGTPKG